MQKILYWIAINCLGFKPFDKKITFNSVLNYLSAKLRQKSTSKAEQEIVKANIKAPIEFVQSPSDITKLVLERTELVRLKSPKCLEEERCIHCKCEIPAKFYELEGCDNGCYGPVQFKV